MKTSIETINGKLYTVIWKHIGLPYARGTEGLEQIILNDGSIVLMDCQHVATALPPLPCHPKPEDAELLHRYMAEGIRVKGVYNKKGNKQLEADILLCVHPEWSIMESDFSKGFFPEITHALTESGERVEIAILEDEDEK